MSDVVEYQPQFTPIDLEIVSIKVIAAIDGVVLFKIYLAGN